MADDNKKRAVGLVILTKIPAMGGLVAVLQRRGKFNHEKMGPESRPGGCQVTCHGKLEESESFLEALQRELSEELGELFRAVLFFDQNWESFIKIVDIHDPEKDIITYGMLVKCEILKFVRFGPSTGGFEFVTCEGVDKIRNLNEFDKRIGVTDLNTIAMFPDEIKAVQKAFEVLGK